MTLNRFPSMTKRYVVQEFGLGLGFAPAALPLWDHFHTLMSTFRDQLQNLVPMVVVTEHLLKLAGLYETQSPPLAEMCIILSSSFAGENAGEDSENYYCLGKSVSVCDKVSHAL